MELRTQNLSDTQDRTSKCTTFYQVFAFNSYEHNSHERFFGFQRRSPCGSSLPTWLSVPGNVMLRRFVRNSKNESLLDEVVLTGVNPAYAHIR